VAALRASGLAVDDAILRAGIRDAMLPGRFQIISDAPRVILDVAHNPHAAAYLAGRLKTLAKTGRVLAVIGMLHDKDIAGTGQSGPGSRRLVLRAAGRPRGATAEQLVEHLRGGTVYSSVAQAWHAAMADAKVEDTVLVCGSFHTVAQVMEEIDAGRIGGE
jgi:dihydrofolate synthase/folylpolyglutamate synthase